MLCQALGRLHLPEMVDDDKIRMLKLLVHNVFTVCRFRFLRACTDIFALFTSVDPSEMSLHAVHLQSSTPRSARNMRTSYPILARKSIANLRSLRGCSSFWTILYHWMMVKRWRCPGRGDENGAEP